MKNLYLPLSHLALNLALNLAIFSQTLPSAPSVSTKLCESQISTPIFRDFRLRLESSLQFQAAGWISGREWAVPAFSKILLVTRNGLVMRENLDFVSSTRQDSTTSGVTYLITFTEAQGSTKDDLVNVLYIAN